jgi:hypothetical protein
MLNRILRTFLLTALLMLITFSRGMAQDNTPKYSNEFLALGVGAKAFALGNAQTSFVDDASSAYWNPAGLLAMQTDQQLMLMHTSYFAGIANYDFGAFAIKSQDSSALAISMIRFSVDDIPDTRFLFDANGAINYDRIQFFSASDYALFLSYARRLKILGGVNFGANVKVIHRLVGSFSRAWGFGLDAGVQKKVGNWYLGISGKDVFTTFNAWSHNVDELRDVYQATNNDLPVSTVEITLPRWILGAAYRWDISSQFSLLTTTDVQLTFDGKRNTLLASNLVSVDPMGGVEVGFRDLVFLRYGVNQFQEIERLYGSKSWSMQMSGGIGLKLRELSIDYALTDLGDQAAGLYSHVFSIKVDFYAKED